MIIRLRDDFNSTEAQNSTGVASSGASSSVGIPTNLTVDSDVLPTESTDSSVDVPSSTADTIPTESASSSVILPTTDSATLSDETSITDVNSASIGFRAGSTLASIPPTASDSSEVPGFDARQTDGTSGDGSVSSSQFPPVFTPTPFLSSSADAGGDLDSSTDSDSVTDTNAGLSTDSGFLSGPIDSATLSPSSSPSPSASITVSPSPSPSPSPTFTTGSSDGRAPFQPPQPLFAPSGSPSPSNGPTTPIPSPLPSSGFGDPPIQTLNRNDPTSASQPKSSDPSSSSPDPGAQSGGNVVPKQAITKGAIAGGVIGGILFLALIALVGMFIVRKRNRQRRRAETESFYDAMSYLEPLGDDPFRDRHASGNNNISPTSPMRYQNGYPSR